MAPEARIRLGAPFEEMTGPEALWEQVYQPLASAMPGFERRDFIVMAGASETGARTGDWVGIGGNLIGALAAPWLGIRAQSKPVFMRYHEYYRIESDRIVEMEGLWDIPQVMRQIDAWPMAEQRGVEWMCPGPADGGGTLAKAYDAQRSQASVQVVRRMLDDLGQQATESPERGLADHWHPECLWYGPTGIGSARGHSDLWKSVFSGFRSGLSDNRRHLDEGVFFGDGDLVAFTGWPSGTATHSGEGFLGLAPTGRRISRRSLDFWRIEDGLIRENWVLVDMIDLYRQLGVDIFARMHALARH